MRRRIQTDPTGWLWTGLIERISQDQRSRARALSCRRLPRPLAAKDTRWHAVVVPGWYGAGERTLEIASGTAVWRHGGLPIVPIRWVLVRDPESRFAPQALHRSRPRAGADRVLVREALECRGHLPRGARSPRDGDAAAVVGQGHRPHHAQPAPLFSIVTLLAKRLPARQRQRIAAAAWYL